MTTATVRLSVLVSSHRNMRWLTDDRMPPMMMMPVHVHAVLLMGNVPQLPVLLVSRLRCDRQPDRWLRQAHHPCRAIRGSLHTWRHADKAAWNRPTDGGRERPAVGVCQVRGGGSGYLPCWDLILSSYMQNDSSSQVWKTGVDAFGSHSMCTAT